MNTTPSRIGFISTRFLDGDSVSSETEIWTGMLNGMGHECFFFAGECDRNPDRSMIIPEAGRDHPDILQLSRTLFDECERTTKTSGLVHALRFHLKQNLYQFIRMFDINLLVIENALSLPLNVPLGLALTEIVAETGLRTIVHHFDFAWHRSRYTVTAADDYLRTAFPASLTTMHHVVTNSVAARQLAARTGVPARTIPFVMDFDNPPNTDDEQSAGLLDALDIDNGRRILLQPTSIAPRKRIELSIDLTQRVADNAVLLITQPSEEQESGYKNRLIEHAEALGVEVVFGADHLQRKAGIGEDGERRYAIQEAYRIADLVSYPSTLEGYGQAFLESIYFKRPVLISRHAIYKLELQPKGFQLLPVDHFIDDETVTQARRILTDENVYAEMVNHNYEVGRMHYSYHTLVSHLSALLDEILGS